MKITYAHEVDVRSIILNSMWEYTYKPEMKCKR